MITVVTWPSFSMSMGMIFPHPDPLPQGRGNPHSAFAICLFLDSNPPATFVFVDIDDGITFGFGCTRDISPAFGVINQQLQKISTFEVFKADLGFGPVKW